MADNNATIKPPVNTTRTGVAGQASVYNKDKYRMKTHQYPEDLFNNLPVYGDNYVVFYINVPSDTKLIKEGKVTVTDKDTTTLGSALESANITGAQAVGAVGAAVAGVGKFLGFDVGSSSLAGFAGSALVTGKSNYGTDKDFLKTPMRQSRRITESITLNIPQTLVTRYGMNYSEEDMAAMTALAHVGPDIKKFAEDASKGSTMQSAMATEASSAIAGAALQTPGVGGFMSAATGLAANPKKEQVFKGVEFRTFNFQYVFAPRNKKEAAEVKAIIQAFKLHMHPEYKDANGYLFLYPSEFDIVYYQGSQENMNLPRHTSCVLVEMSVNYTPNNQFNTFDDGGATQTEVNLVFKELAILTKAEIEDGF